MKAARAALMARVLVRDSYAKPHMIDRKESAVLLHSLVPFASDDPTVEVVDMADAHEH